VFIGSSRILFDVDIDVWQEDLGGSKPIMLALEGTSPRPFLSDLARDEDFTGFLVVGVTPGIYFDEPGGPRMGALKRYTSQTPAQWVGHWLSVRLERGLAFLDGDTRIFTQLERLGWPTSRGMRPPLQMPRKMMVLDENRNTRMWSRLDTDEAYAQLARDIWYGFMQIPSPPPTDEVADEAIESTREDVEKIRARGGEVIFVRCPSDGEYAPREAERQPRARFWDRLIAEVPATGIHFADHESLQGFVLPEWSHITSRQEDEFTRALAALVKPTYEAWQSAR
jgi:hypothetical protein